MKKTGLKNFLLGTIVLTALFLPFVSLLAAEGYTLLAPLPGLPTTLDQDNILGTYLPAIFKLAIGLAAVAAVAMIVIGGFQYMSSDAIMGKTAGRERAKNAIIALVLIIVSWLILNEINPNLLNVSFDLEPAVVATPKGVLGGELSAGTGKALSGYTLTQAEIDKNKAMVEDLKKFDIQVNNNGKPCSDGAVSGCTNLVGLPAVTYNGVKDLKSACGTGCGVTITGGTEGGHASHGPNMNALDLAFNSTLDKYIIDNKIKEPQQTSLGPIYTSKIGNRNATFLRESDHWHVVFE